MTVNLKFNGKIYPLQLKNVDIWDRTAGIDDTDLESFIGDILKNNPNLAPKPATASS